MYEMENLELNIEDLFKDPVEETNEEIPASENTETTEIKSETTTEAVSKRINEVRKKTESETEERIAKDLGYNSYSELLKDKEKSLLKSAGLDDEEVSAIVEQLVEKRFQSDPRMKKLEQLELDEKKEFVTSQLKEINTLSGNNYTSIDQLPKETLELWEKTGNLKQAYLATKGEELITKSKSTAYKGTLDHLVNPGTGTSSSKTRLLTEDEKAIFRAVLGDYANEEELSKKTRPFD